MTTESLEKGQDLQHTIGHLDPQIRKLTEAASFMKINGEKYHYHIQVLPFGLQTPGNFLNSWHFLPEYLVDMCHTQLDKLKAERDTLQAEFDAL